MYNAVGTIRVAYQQKQVLMTDTLLLALDRMAHGGEALGRAADGRVVFVQGGLPGESVTVRLTESHERYGRGVITALPDSPSPDRVLQPPCPHFGAWPARGEVPATFCGGCHWQHIAYPAQLRFKTDVLRDQLARLGGIDNPAVENAVGMAEPWHYRNRVRLHVGPEGPGFFAADGAAICRIVECPIAHPDAFELLAAVEGDLPPGTEVDLRAGLGTGDQLVALWGVDELIDELELETEIEASVVLVREDGSMEVAAGQPYLVESLGGRSFIIPAMAFFQVNTALAAVLVDRIRTLVPPGSGTLVDVHSGVGTFAILLADLADEIYAIESDPIAVGAAVENAAGLDNVTLVEADAAEGLAYLDRAPDVVILDPPRTGLDRATVELLTERPADTIIYVSCEPATLARDARQLVAGGWRHERSWPVDMFPQTYHIESVNLFRRS